MNQLDKLIDYAIRISSVTKLDKKELTNVLSSYTELNSELDEYNEYKNINNIVDLPFKQDAKVVKYIKSRYQKNIIYTWAGQALIAVHPYEEYNKYDRCDGPNIESVITKAWFKLSRGLGKRNQNVVISGESGSGKTYSACLAMKFIAAQNNSNEATSGILWKTWSSVPLLTAFGNAPTKYNNNSSRFGKLIQMQYFDGQIEGAFVETYLLEKCRVSCPNFGEGNFHIFQQILESVDSEMLTSVRLNKSVPYTIAPKCEKQMRSTYYETIRALDILGIHKFQEILIILATILNLGNINFEVETEVYTVSKGTQVFLANACHLLQISDTKEMSDIFTTKVFATSQTQQRRGTFYHTPCTTREECEERKNCFMRLLYENLFIWLVKEINDRIHSRDNRDYQLLGILDVYGFEIFNINTFEQLCINYANERLHCYFVNDYLVEQREELLSEGFNIEPVVNISEYLERVHLIDGTVSIFGIINEECLVKRFNNDVFINTRIVETLKSRKYFIGLINDFSTNFTVKHFAGEVTYDTRTMLNKNRDKIPDDILSFLRSSKFGFLLEILKEETDHRRSQTLLKQFKRSLDNLVHKLDQGNVHYIKCLKPNAYHISKFFDDDYFLTQLNANGVLDITKLAFQNYSIKLNFEALIKQFSVDSYNILQRALPNDVHVGRKLIYLTEKGFTAFETCEFLKKSNAARKIQRYWRNYNQPREVAARIIQQFFNKFIRKNNNLTYDNFIDLSKKSSDAPCARICALDHLSCVSSYSKTLLFLKTNNLSKNFEGDPLSFCLEKIYLKIKTKPFRRILFCGNGIVSYIRLAEIPIRLHLSKTCIRNSHLLPKSELPKGLLDIF